jgi:acetate kinase
MIDAVLTINAGSSGVKVGLFDASAGARPREIARDAHALENGMTHEDALAALLQRYDRAFPDARIVAAGHRVVHGGERFITPVRVTPDIRAALERLAPLAPLHQPHNLAAIDALARRPAISAV